MVQTVTTERYGPKINSWPIPHPFGGGIRILPGIKGKKKEEMDAETLI